MSYDISFKVKVEGTETYYDTAYCHANITWNVRKIIELSTGLEWINEANNGLCADIIPKIEKGLLELINHPEKYKKYEAENGWGTVDGTKRFFAEILDDWKDFVWDYPELKYVATFWIE